MGKRPLSKKELEEQRKKEQEQAAAQVSGDTCKFTLLSRCVVLLHESFCYLQAFEEFVATFQETPNKTTNKVWVKAGTYDAGKRRKHIAAVLYAFMN